MKRGVLLFSALVLAAATFFIGVFVGARKQVHRLTDYLPSTRLAQLHAQIGWTTNAAVHTSGSLLVTAPSDPHLAAAVIIPSRDPHYPLIVISDENPAGTGVVDSIFVADLEGRQFDIVDRDGDGCFDACNFAIGTGSNRFVVSDRNCDGVFDIRLSPDGSNAAMVGDCWLPFEVHDGKMIVGTGDERRQIVFRDGRCRFADE